jgi:hypothetical protein
VVYQGVFEGMSLSFGALFYWSLWRKHLTVALTPPAARAASIRFGPGNLPYLAAMGVAFLSPAASLLISAPVALYYVFEHIPARPAAPPAIGTGNHRHRLARVQLSG